MMNKNENKLKSEKNVDWYLNFNCKLETSSGGGGGGGGGDIGHAPS